MNAIHLHLAINHIAVIGTGLTLFLFLIGVLKRSDELIKTSFLIFFLIALTAIPTFFSGEAAEEIVEGMAGMSEDLIERHESAAKLSMVVEMAAGLLALLGLILYRLNKTAPAWLKVVFPLAALAATGFMVWTANLGGQIRHEEIRPSVMATTVYEHSEGR